MLRPAFNRFVLFQKYALLSRSLTDNSWIAVFDTIVSVHCEQQVNCDDLEQGIVDVGGVGWSWSCNFVFELDHDYDAPSSSRARI